MSRRGIIDLSELINRYKEGKDVESKIKKSNAELNEAIKNYMTTHDMSTADSDLYTATLSTTKKDTLNDDVALAIIKENLGGALLKSVVKTKEYIDEDALETLIYNGDFDANKLSKAITTKTTTTLRIAKKKAKKL